MKTTKTINVKLNARFDACFTLEFKQDKQGNEYGILTAPYVKWISMKEQEVHKRVYELFGKELECIEKLYFDNQVISIIIDEYPDPIDMEDIIHKIIPQEIYDKILPE